ncbi:MAG TPA: flavodoxin [Veillonellaceae bacterium]|nr:flavodoxin [Veillonellaceae bacterium]
MTKTAIVYWTGSGNTEAMAQAVEEGAKSAGAETFLSFVSDTSAADISAYDHIILGCPAMGNEELEEYEFEPFFDELLPQMKGKKVGIFGSYAWNQGDWIKTWKERMEEAGVTLAADPVKAYSYPDDDALAACKALGETIAKA